MNCQQYSEVWIDRERMSGEPCFRGTHVPVAALFNNLEGGATAEEFVRWFPGVTRAQVREVLRFAMASLEAERAA